LAQGTSRTYGHDGPYRSDCRATDVGITGELTKLAEMRNNCIRTDEELATAKAKVLS
jgi:hypothetical protein